MQYIIFIAAVLVLGGMVIYLKVEVERLRRENRLACMRENSMQERIASLKEQVHTISLDRDAMEYRARSTTDYRVMVRDTKITALEKKLEAIEKKHKAELESKDLEIRNQTMMINTFKKQIDRLSGMSELNKEAGT